MSTKRKVQYGLLALAVVIAVLSIPAFAASIWTMGSPHNLSMKWGATGFLALVVAALVVGLAGAVHDTWPTLPERQENR